MGACNYPPARSGPYQPDCSTAHIRVPAVSGPDWRQLKGKQERGEDREPSRRVRDGASSLTETVPLVLQQPPLRQMPPAYPLRDSLLREDEQAPRYDARRLKALGVAKHSIPAKDFHPPTPHQLVTFVDLVEGQAADVRVVVHCQGGTGRTGTFAAAYWIAKGLAVIARLVA